MSSQALGVSTLFIKHKLPLHLDASREQQVKRLKKIIRLVFLTIVAVIAAELVVSIFIKDVSAGAAENIFLGNWTKQRLETLMSLSGDIEDRGTRIGFLSENFLGTPYAEKTLGGGDGLKEKLTIDLSGVDCFTYIDYVESMRLSRNFEQFRTKLTQTRYKNGSVEWRTRKHFFSDWVSGKNPNAQDVTRRVGGDASVTVVKQLNKKKDGSLRLPGISVMHREISYIPSEKLSPGVLSSIETGDYLGIYTELSGLDVTHAGVAIRKDSEVYLRHASSVHKKVVDDPLATYMKKKPGLVVYRAR